VDVYNQDKLLTRVVCTGVHIPQCFTAAKAGAHIVMIPYDEYLQMGNHLLTYIGLPRSQWLESIFPL
jgi:hypothetical protein